jgi:hypothetical protein
MQFARDRGAYALPRAGDQRNAIVAAIPHVLSQDPGDFDARERCISAAIWVRAVRAPGMPPSPWPRRHGLVSHASLR